MWILNAYRWHFAILVCHVTYFQDNKIHTNTKCFSQLGIIMLFKTKHSLIHIWCLIIRLIRFIIRWNLNKNVQRLYGHSHIRSWYSCVIMLKLIIEACGGGLAIFLQTARARLELSWGQLVRRCCEASRAFIRAGDRLLCFCAGKLCQEAFFQGRTSAWPGAGFRSNGD